MYITRVEVGDTPPPNPNRKAPPSPSQITHQASFAAVLSLFPCCFQHCLKDSICRLCRQRFVSTSISHAKTTPAI